MIIIYISVLNRKSSFQIILFRWNGEFDNFIRSGIIIQDFNRVAIHNSNYQLIQITTIIYVKIQMKHYVFFWVLL